MSVQTTYGYTSPLGVAGGLYDMSPRQVDSRANGAETAGAIKLGMGVVQGAKPGVNVALPASSSEMGAFEGIVIAGGTNEMNADGAVTLNPKETLNILRYGRAWARVVDADDPVYGEPLYLANTGADAGLFTNDDATGIEVKGMFIGGKDTTGIAPVELYNQLAQ